jgi:iron complex outermembrane recepter protein
MPKSSLRELKPEEKVEVGTDAEGKAAAKQGNITVTGSRIVRDTYSSISPLQVITTENQQAIGAFDPAQILQRSESACGSADRRNLPRLRARQRPGFADASTCAALVPTVTLVLANGRRIAPGRCGRRAVEPFDQPHSRPRWSIATTSSPTVLRRFMVQTRSRAWST